MENFLEIIYNRFNIKIVLDKVNVSEQILTEAREIGKTPDGSTFL